MRPRAPEKVSRMVCCVNGKEINLAEGTNVVEFFNAQGISTDGIALAINEEVIPKSLWAKTQINQNDNILIITATQGG